MSEENVHILFYFYFGFAEIKVTYENYYVQGVHIVLLYGNMRLLPHDYQDQTNYQIRRVQSYPVYMHVSLVKIYKIVFNVCIMLYYIMYYI